MYFLLPSLIFRVALFTLHMQQSAIYRILYGATNKIWQISQQEINPLERN
jgi:hypothetical protein